MHVVVLAGTSEQYLAEKTPPLCPSVMLDASFLINNGTISFHDISAVVLSDDCDIEPPCGRDRRVSTIPSLTLPRQGGGK
jgi:hypothetical protein